MVVVEIVDHKEYQPLVPRSSPLEARLNSLAVTIAIVDGLNSR